MKNKKGFTLVEILGVLVILVIILAISVPKILDIINSSGKKAFTSDVKELIGTSTLEYNEKLEGNTQDIWYYFSEGEQINYIEDGKLHFKGEKPSSGYILVTKDGEIELELVSNDKKWCASKELNQKNPVIDNCKLKEKEPINLSLGVSNTTKSITVTVSPSDLNTYYYKLDDGEYKSSSSNIKLFDNLEKNKKYKITVKGCRKSESVCAEDSVEVTLPNLEKPTYSIASVPTDQNASNGWATSRTVTINYSQPKDVLTDYSKLENYYIYAPTIDELTQKISKNEWQLCSNDSCTLEEFTSDVYIIAIITDGYNELTNSVQKLTNFDTEKPTAPIITGGSTSWSNTSRTISVSTKSVAKSGIKKYQYYISTSNTKLEGGSWKDCATSNISQNFSTHGTYYIYFKAISYVGLESSPSNVQVVMVDKQAPSTPSVTNSSGGSWTKNNVTISASSTDAHSGIDQIYYSYDNSNWSTSWGQSYTAITNGKSIYGVWIYTQVSTVYVRACDAVGNCSASATTPLKLDKTAPSTPTVTNSSGGSWTKNNVTITASSTDAHSGINQIYYSYDNSNWYTSWGQSYTAITNGKSIYGVWSGNYNNTVYVRSCDAVGNCSASATTAVKIDVTPPSTPSVSNSSGGSWTSGSVTISASSTDTGSGVDQIYYSYNASTWNTSWGQSYTAITNGKSIYGVWSSKISSAVYIRACDVVGNCSGNATTSVNIGEYSQSSACGTESYSYSCTKYDYRGGYCGETCTISYGGSLVATSNCSGAFACCCKIPYSGTCSGTRYKTCWHL